MEVILNNPFRILGLPVTASERQISKRIDDLALFAEMGKAKQYDTDFPFISSFDRTPESIQRAASQIELPEQKLFYAFFWFWSGNSVDELVFEVLNDGNPSKAKELWHKPIRNLGLSSKNLSSYRNLGLLNIVLSQSNGSLQSKDFLEAVRLLIEAINHESINEHLGKIVGNNYNYCINELQKPIVDEILRIVKTANNEIIERQTLLAFEGASKNVIEYVSSKLRSEPIRILEGIIQKCKNIRENESESILDAAGDLYWEAKPILQKLVHLLTKFDVHYQFIADKVASELLRCSTAHYNIIIKSDDGNKAIDEAEKITLWAQLVAVSTSVKSEVEDDLEQINGIRKNKIEEHRESKVLAQWEEFLELIENLPQGESLTSYEMNRLPDTLLRFINNSKSQIELIRQLGGGDHDAFIASNEMTVGIILNLSIAYANKTRDYNSVIPMLEKIESLKMDSELRNRFKENKRILHLNRFNQQAAERQRSSGWCYIATLVYGSYDAPEVLVLRRFRDNVLAKSCAGRLFIQTYYSISPTLVKLLANQTYIQGKIRNILDLVTRKLN